MLRRQSTGDKLEYSLFESKSTETVRTQNRLNRTDCLSSCLPPGFKTVYQLRKGFERKLFYSFLSFIFSCDLTQKNRDRSDMLGFLQRVMGALISSDAVQSDAELLNNQNLSFL